MQAFIEVEGRVPENLTELLPKYLEAIPTLPSGVGAFELGDDNTEATQRPWSLSVDCSRGPVNWDVFVYWPAEDYPGVMYGGVVERIGRWAYVHE